MTASSAARLIDGLVELGVDYVFANLGTDHVSIIEELARREEEGLASPRVILCEHENVAVHMAGGYALATGRGQAVLVHVDAGTANASMAIHNLFRTRAPVLLMAGRAPYSLGGALTGSRDTYVHFVQDPFDMGSLVRPYMKWEYELPSGLLSKQAIQRAHAVMQSDPMGPVYLTFARETLAEEYDEDQFAGLPEQRGSAVKVGGIDPATTERIADALMSARHPIAIVAYLGRNPEAAEVLEALACECGIQVAQFNPTHANIRSDSPCFAGFDPAQIMDEADFGLLLDVDVPFIPKASSRADQINWLQIDLDPLKADFAVWGFSSDFAVRASCAVALAQVLETVRTKADGAFRARVAKRMDAFAAASRMRRGTLAAAVAAARSGKALSAAYVCDALARRLDASDILVNEAVTNAGHVLDHMPRQRPATYFANGGGGLGFSGGVALGLKLANPERRVVQVVGDGVFHFCNPDSVYATAQRYDLPILTVVLDNGGWQAVKSSVRRVYPHGASARGNRYYARLTEGHQGEQRRFHEVARAFGAYGEEVSDPADLADAIDRCLRAVDEGQASVLHIRLPSL